MCGQHIRCPFALRWMKVFRETIVLQFRSVFPDDPIVQNILFISKLINIFLLENKNLCVHQKVRRTFYDYHEHFYSKVYHFDRVLTEYNMKNTVAYAKLAERNLPAGLTDAFNHGRTLLQVIQNCAQLPDSLVVFKDGLLPFANVLHASDRAREDYAAVFGEYFPESPEFSLTDPGWMSLVNLSVQYLSTILPGKDDPQIVKRIHYVSFVGMLRSDIFEGLCFGHAPRKCPICGKWFLTTDARHDDHWDYASILWGRVQTEWVQEAFEKLSFREQTLLEKHNAICMTCGRVSDWRKRVGFEDLAVLFEGSGASGAERAYQRALEKMMKHLAGHEVFHVLQLRLVSQEKKNKKSPPQSIPVGQTTTANGVRSVLTF